MGKLTIVLTDDVEKQLRDHIRGKGDISAIIEEALVNWLRDAPRVGTARVGTARVEATG